MGPEQTLSRAFASWTKANLPDHALAWKIHGGGMGANGKPDWMIVSMGMCLFIELKAPGKNPTPLQALCHEKIRGTYTPCVVCRSMDECRDAVHGFLCVEVGR